MTQNVLCAIDVNRPQEESKLLLMAAQQADLDGGQLDVITVLPDFGTSMVGAYFEEHHVDTAKSKATKQLNEMVINTLGEDRNSKIRHVVAVGKVYQEVLKTAELVQANLIVVGAHDPELKDYLLGPNAARIVRHSDCSVFVVRD